MSLITRGKTGLLEKVEPAGYVDPDADPPPHRGDLAGEKMHRMAVKQLWPGAIALVGKSMQWADATLDNPQAGERAQASAAKTGIAIPGVLIEIERAPLERQNLRLRNTVLQIAIDGGPQPDNLIDEIRSHEDEFECRQLSGKQEDPPCSTPHET